MEWKRGMRYVPGTLIQRRDGYVFMKTREGKLMAEHRWVAEQNMIHRKLREGEVVVRLRPKRDDNRPENLVVVQHALTKFAKLPMPRILYVPARQKQAA